MPLIRRFRRVAFDCFMANCVKLAQFHFSVKTFLIIGKDYHCVVDHKKTGERFGQLSTLHRRVGNRLAYARRDNGLSQNEFAGRFGLSRNQLANIETGRVALSLHAGYKMAQELDISPGWFVGGKELPFPILDQRLADWLEHFCANKRESAFAEVWPGIHWITDLDPEENKELFDRFFEASSQFDSSDPLRPGPISDPAKIVLTSSSLKGNSKGVQYEIKKLIERVKRKASKPGAKAELARALGVKPPRISEWLSGEKEPGGDYTLRLLRWVEQQECQK